MPFHAGLIRLQGRVALLRLTLYAKPPLGFVCLLGQRIDHEAVRRLVHGASQAGDAFS